MAATVTTHSLTETSYSVENNSSQVRYLVQVTTNSSTYNNYGIVATYYIDGVEYQSASIRMPASSTTTFVDHTVTIYHNADGTRSVSASYSIPTRVSSGTLTGSTSLTLTTIPRASSPSVSGNVNLGSAVTIYTNRASSSFTHTISYSCAGYSGTIATNVGASTSWTPSLNIANGIPNGTSATCTITCTTYNGSTNLGSKTCVLTLYVPSSIVPSVSITSVSEANSTVSALNWGVYVQGKSQLAVSVSGSGSYSSTIRGYSTSANGVTYTSSSFTTGTISSNGTIRATATDSRGRTSATATSNYTVVAYSEPTISEVSVARCDSSGTIKDDGTYLKYTFKGSISPVDNKNSASFRIKYKAHSASSWTTREISTAYSIDSSAVLSNATFSADTTYDILFEAVDSLSTASYPTELGTGFELVNYNASGKGIAFGKVSESDTMEVALDTDFQGEVSINGTELKNYLLDMIYPVGSIYMSISSTSPATLFGGTWTQITGRFLWATSSTPTQTGGSQTVTLSESNLPSHGHSIPSLSGSTSENGNHNHVLNITPSNTVSSGSSYRRPLSYGTNDNPDYSTNTTGNHTHSITTNASNTGYTGSGTAFSIMPPYYEVYMWRRTA